MEGLAAQELRASAREMEQKMLVLLSGMLEGDAAQDVLEHLASTLDVSVVVSLLNLHWCAAKREHARKKGAASAGARSGP